MGKTEASGHGRWAAWLQGQLDAVGWTQADLVRAAGEKENGRPLIGPDMVWRWLKEGRQPSLPSALRVAEAMNIPAPEALAAAGHSAVDLAGVSEAVAPRPAGGLRVPLRVVAEPSRLSDEELAAELRRLAGEAARRLIGEGNQSNRTGSDDPDRIRHDRVTDDHLDGVSASHHGNGTEPTHPVPTDDSAAAAYRRGNRREYERGRQADGRSIGIPPEER